MRAFTITKGKTIAVPIDAIDPKQITWIRAIAPNEEELKQLVAISGVPIEELRESVEEEERPRLSKKKYLELIYDTPHTFRNEGLQTMEVYFYISGKLVITIEEEPARVLSKIEEKIVQGRKNFLFKNQGQFLFQVLDEINDDFLNQIERVARKLSRLRKDALTVPDIDSLSDTNVTFSYFNQAIIANLEVLNQLRKCHHAAFVPADRASFNELYVDKLQILDTEKIQRELVMHLISIQSIRSAERLNHTMKRLTAFALLVMIPTLITGMYGMNVPLPFQNHPHSFAIIMGGTVAISLVLLWVMRKLEWV